MDKVMRRSARGTYVGGPLLSLTLVGGLAACGGDSGGDGVEASTGGSASTGGGTDTSGDGDGDGSSWRDWEPEVAWPTLECDPLDPNFCAFPFPNNVYTETADTPTGRQVRLAAATVVTAENGSVTDPAPWNTFDGFSHSIPLMVHMPGATDTGLASSISIADSMLLDSPTVIIEAETGERVPHWSELDVTTDDSDRSTFLVRPAVRLKDATRYVVAIRNVVDDSGVPIPASEAFAALRDGASSADPTVDSRRGLYADIFTRLEGAGVEVDELQVAWDFTTASKENLTGPFLHMRDEAMAAYEEGRGPSYTIREVESDWNTDNILHRIDLRMEVPQYLDDPNNAISGALNYGADGLPEPVGTYQEDVEIWIPQSATGTPAALMQYGHGLLGDRSQIGSGHFRSWGNLYGYAFFGVDMKGMATFDRVALGLMLEQGRFNEFLVTVDRLHQGMLNHLLAMRMVANEFANDPTYGPLLDPSRRYYHGISQGGIFGGTYMAVTQDVERGALGVPGQPYSLLLTRSVDFDDFFDIARSSYRDPREVMLMIALAQSLWDRITPSTYTAYISGDDRLPDTPDHRVFMRVAVGDHQVSPLGAHVMARAVDGTQHLDSGVRPIYGFEAVADQVEGNAIVEYDFGLPDAPVGNVPLRECSDPHGKLRSLEEARVQLDRFYREGVVANTCTDGVCSFPDMSGCP